MNPLLCFFFLLIATASFSQHKPSLLKSWIKVRTENLADATAATDTLYARYTFARGGKLNIGLYPGWDDYKQSWSQNNGVLTIGLDAYRIEAFTDTSLTIALDGFRRFRYLAENYLADQPQHSDSIGLHNGKPVYKANRYVSPRYKKEQLRNELQKSLEPYHGRQAAWFVATFMVTDEGKVEEIRVVNSINEGFDREFAKQLSKTSGHWRPAMVRGRAVQTQMTYEIKYLSALVPYKSGRINPL